MWNEISKELQSSLKMILMYYIFMYSFLGGDGSEGTFTF